MRSLLVALAVIPMACEGVADDVAASNESTETAKAELVTSTCLQQVLATIGNGQAIDPRQLQLDIEACIASNYDGGLPAIFDGGFPPLPPLPSFDAGLPPLPSFDAGLPPLPSFDAGLPPLPSFDAGLPPLPSFDAGLPPLPSFDAGVPPIPAFDAGVPDYSGAGQPCPASGACGPNLRCLNPLGRPLPNPYAVCIPG